MKRRPPIIHASSRTARESADWPEDQIVGRDTVEARGGKWSACRRGRYSTSALLKKIAPEQAVGAACYDWRLGIAHLTIEHAE